MSTFVMVDPEVVSHTGLSVGAKLLYIELSNLSGSFEEQQLYTELGMSKSKYYRLRKELIDFGLVEIRKEPGQEPEMYVRSMETVRGMGNVG